MDPRSIKELPCSEETFPYRNGPSETKDSWKNFREESSKMLLLNLKSDLQSIEPDNIAEMKKFLAAADSSSFNILPPVNARLFRYFGLTLSTLHR